MTVEEIDAVLQQISVADAAIAQARKGAKASDILWCRVAVDRRLVKAAHDLADARQELRRLRGEVAHVEAGGTLPLL